MRWFSTRLAVVFMLWSLAACGLQQGGEAPRASKRIVPAGLFLTVPFDGPDQCVAKTVPGRIQVRKNEDIEWTIVDLCKGTANYTKDVELRWLDVPDKCAGQNSPLDPPGNPKGKQQIKGAIHASCPLNKIFKYEIWLDGKRLADPEVEIVQ